MDLQRWLIDWLSQHPLQRPPSDDRARYTREVMARVRLAASPGRAPARWPLWLLWPRLGLTLAAAAAGVLLAAGTLRLTALRQAQAPAPEEGTYRLAESPDAGEDQWLADTMQLLEQLDEEIEAAEGEPDDDNALKELQLLDETELAAS